MATATMRRTQSDDRPALPETGFAARQLIRGGAHAGPTNGLASGYVQGSLAILPRYRVWRDGAIVDEPTDLLRWWRDDLVVFAIGCSFSFEQGLIEDGIELRHFICNCTVPMYRTTIETAAAGPVATGNLRLCKRPSFRARAQRGTRNP